ncbi:MAG: DeoR/GlpR family DNA-binding transcription regulator [Erysipelotrichaceae bacterium]|nr:DeoR/GlpR family DNA-binding transcription regulator [Erysipelotrichaceae bacterium]
MLAHDRKFYIMKQLKKEGTIQVKEIAEWLKTSEATIRRDLMELDQEGKVHRIHGGATIRPITGILTEQAEIQMQDRLQVNARIKEKICEEAAKAVKDGECIFLDGGTSIMPMIHYLANRPIKVVTHNHLIIQQLDHPVAEIIVIGGNYHAKYNMSYGPVAENGLRMYNFDRAFIGCAGVDLNQQEFYTAEVDTLELKRIAMQHSNYNYLLIDDRKLFVKGFCRVGSTEDFEGIYCNQSERLPNEIPPQIHVVTDE